MPKPYVPLDTARVDACVAEVEDFLAKDVSLPLVLDLHTASDATFETVYQRLFDLPMSGPLVVDADYTITVNSPHCEPAGTCKVLRLYVEPTDLGDEDEYVVQDTAMNTALRPLLEQMEYYRLPDRERKAWVRAEGWTRPSGKRWSSTWASGQPSHWSSTAFT